MSDQETTQNVLGKRLKEEREHRGFSQEEIASHLGVPRSAISLIESGSRRVSADELGRLAKLYQTSTKSLQPDEAQ